MRRAALVGKTPLAVTLTAQCASPADTWDFGDGATATGQTVRHTFAAGARARFLRGFAVHGYPGVPPYPASHGCVRVPMWIATTIYATMPPGSTVYVYE